jgi:hypothetical protein
MLQQIIEKAYADLVEARDPEIINALKILIAEAQAKQHEVENAN